MSSIGLYLESVIEINVVSASRQQCKAVAHKTAIATLKLQLPLTIDNHSQQQTTRRRCKELGHHKDRDNRRKEDMGMADMEGILHRRKAPMEEDTGMVVILLKDTEGRHKGAMVDMEVIPRNHKEERLGDQNNHNNRTAQSWKNFVPSKRKTPVFSASLHYARDQEQGDHLIQLN